MRADTGNLTVVGVVVESLRNFSPSVRLHALFIRFGEHTYSENRAITSTLRKHSALNSDNKHRLTAAGWAQLIARLDSLLEGRSGKQSHRRHPFVRRVHGSL